MGVGSRPNITATLSVKPPATRVVSQGIPYNTLMLNSINHPDERGMKLFADSLMELFP